MNTIITLLVSFLQIGFCSIGGGYATIPLIEQQVVTVHHWLDMQAFTDIITISQMTPGPLAVNTSTFVGIQIAGAGGAVAATFGCIITGVTASVLLYVFFDKYKNGIRAGMVLKGLRASSAGLIAASACTILQLAFFGAGKGQLALASLNASAVGLFFVSFYLLRRRQINPIAVIVLSGAAGFLLYA